MNTPTSFFHLAVTCENPAKFEQFYTRHFGMKRARTVELGEGNEIVFLKSDDGFYFEIFSKEEERPVPFAEGDGPHYPGIRHIAFTVDDVDQKLKDMGEDAEITMGPMSFDDFIPGWKTAWIKDPEGNIIELTQGFKDQ